MRLLNASFLRLTALTNFRCKLFSRLILLFIAFFLVYGIQKSLIKSIESHQTTQTLPKEIEDPAPEFLLNLINGTFPTIPNSNSIPRIIHQTYKSLDAPHPYMTTSRESFINLNPGYEYVFWNDTHVDYFVKKYYRKIYDGIWKDLGKYGIGKVLKADLFRYMVVYTFGGIYADVDVFNSKSVDKWIPRRSPQKSAAQNKNKKGNHTVKNDIKMIISREVDAGKIKTDWWNGWAREMQWCQWAFAGAPKHPILEMIIETAVQRLEKIGIERVWEQKGPVMEYTGPGLWTDTINFYLEAQFAYKWRKFQGSTEPSFVGDVILWPDQTGFSPNPENYDKALARHNFAGVWKTDGVY